MKNIVALFDCDGTLYSAHYGHGLVKYSSENGRKNAVRRCLSASAIPYILRKINVISAEAYLRPMISRLAWMVKGMSNDELQQASNWICNNYLLPTEHPLVTRRLRKHQAQGHLIVLVSAQLFPNLELLGELFNAHGLIGTKLEMKDGRCTGRIIPPVITGEDKDRSTREYFSVNKIDVDWEASYAYADSITDMGLFSMVGHPVAANPGPKLYKLAQRNHWEIVGTPRK